MCILIRVNAADGEESMWLTEINNEELEVLNPLLLEIQKNQGYFPTQDHQDNFNPLPEILYKDFPEAMCMIRKFLPTPNHGYTSLQEVKLFQNDPYSLYM